MRILKLRQVEVVTLIYHQILITNTQGNELKLEGRINNQILGVKGLVPLLCKILYPVGLKLGSWNVYIYHICFDLYE